MSEASYFSKMECAGGCGNLMPQHLVDAGKRFLWGHKNGCPKEGESARRVKAGVVRGSGVGKTKPGAVSHVSYAKTLEMVQESLRSAEGRLTELTREVEAAVSRRYAAQLQLDRLATLRAALVPFVTASTDGGVA